MLLKILAVGDVVGEGGQDILARRLRELREEQVDMFTTVFVGSSTTILAEGHMVTPRGYRQR